MAELSAPAAGRDERGLSVVDVLLAVTLLPVDLTTLGRLFSSGRGTRGAGGRGLEAHECACDMLGRGVC